MAFLNSTPNFTAAVQARYGAGVLGLRGAQFFLPDSLEDALRADLAAEGDEELIRFVERQIQMPERIDDSDAFILAWGGRIINEANRRRRHFRATGRDIGIQEDEERALARAVAEQERRRALQRGLREARQRARNAARGVENRPGFLGQVIAEARVGDIREREVGGLLEEVVRGERDTAGGVGGLFQ